MCGCVQKGELTKDWPMVRKEWALVVFAKEKLMAAAGNEKFLKQQEGAIRDGESPAAYSRFVKRSELRLFETNKRYVLCGRVLFLKCNML